MTRRPKDIGTAAETAVVRYAQTYGYAFADRQPLRGNRDCGDITFCPGFIGEVKGGDNARTASDEQIHRWMLETTTERINGDASMAVLVVARWRQPVERWWGVIWSTDLDVTKPRVPVRLMLRDVLTLARAAGYGDPLDTVEQVSA